MDGRDIVTGRFLKGHRESEQEKLARIKGQRAAWKKNPDYIGDIVKECPYIYNSWRGMMFTKRGKSQGISDEWKNFRTFYNDVRPTYVKGFTIRRTDITKPFSKDNFVWLSKNDAAAMSRGNTVWITYKGETLTFRDWADKLGTSLTAIKTRYYGHPEYSVEEVLLGKKVRRGSKVAKDISNPEVNIRAKASKMISAYRTRDKKTGLEECNLTIEWMVDNILTKPCVYCGDTNRIGCDRIDNSKGHVLGNVVPCCLECNNVRNNLFTYEEMMRLGKVVREIKAERGVDFTERKTCEEIKEEAGHDMEYVRHLNMRKVYKYSLNGELLNTYESAIEAAEKNGTSAKSVGAAVNGMMYNKSYNGHKLKGYLWYNDRTIKEMQKK